MGSAYAGPFCVNGAFVRIRTSVNVPSLLVLLGMMKRRNLSQFSGGDLRMPIIRSFFAAVGLMTILACAGPVAEACTRVLWNDNKLAVVVGRTMDFPVTTEPLITLLPRGMARDGGLFAAREWIPILPFGHRNTQVS